MITRWVRLGSVLTALFAAAIVAICAQAYETVTVHTFFAPEDCPMPCWQGIRPGVTSFASALTILEQHPSVTRIEELTNQTPIGFGQRLLRWAWTEHYPLPLDPPVPHMGMLISADETVREIYLGTGPRLGDLWLTFGSPDGGDIGFIQAANEPSVLINTSVFAQRGMMATSYVDCPMGISGLWRGSTWLWLGRRDALPGDYFRYEFYWRSMLHSFAEGRRKYC